MAKVAYSGAANYDFFWERPIVPKYLHGAPSDKIPTNEVYTDYTTAAAIAIGELTDITPIMVDYYARQIGGGFTADTMALFGRGEHATDDALDQISSLFGSEKTQAANWPVIGRSFLRQKQKLRSVDELYDLHDIIEKKKNSKADPPTPLIERQYAMAVNALRAVTLLARARSDAKTKPEVMALTRKMSSLAIEAKDALEAGGVDREQTFYQKRQLAEADLMVSRGETNPSEVDVDDRRGAIARQVARYQVMSLWGQGTTQQAARYRKEANVAAKAVVALTKYFGGQAAFYNSLSDKKKSAYKGQITNAKKGFYKKYKEIGGI